ncbi:hypothetical protein DFJ74DRAFT_144406 [Hyaloraphidium curvatum]|nr:hypothetical protein DFJ74DRAFT_144406 [Hyaloraphidium curvatum]
MTASGARWWAAAAAVAAVLALLAPCAAAPTDADWTFAQPGFDALGSFAAHLSVPTSSPGLLPLLYNLTSPNITANYSVPAAAPPKANATAADFVWSVLTPAVVDRVGTAVRAIGAVLNDTRWSWGLSLDGNGGLRDGEGLMVEGTSLDVGLLLTASNGTTFVLPGGTLSVARITLNFTRVPNPEGLEVPKGRNAVVVDLEASDLTVPYRGVNLRADYANGSWTLEIPSSLAKSDLASFAFPADANATNSTGSLRAPAVPGVFVNETRTFVKLVAVNNRGQLSWQLDLPRQFGPLDSNGSSLLLGGRARETLAVSLHERGTGSFSTWFVPSAEGFPSPAAGGSFFVPVLQQAWIPVTTNTSNGTNSTTVSLVEYPDAYFPSPDQSRPYFRGSTLRPQLSPDGAFLFAPSRNRSTGAPCLASFDLSAAAAAHFRALADSNSPPARIVAECRPLPLPATLERWQVLDPVPEARNDTPPAGQLFAFYSSAGITALHWADLAPGAFNSSGLPVGSTSSPPGYSSDAELVPAARNITVEALGNITADAAASEQTLLYSLDDGVLRLLWLNASATPGPWRLLWERSLADIRPNSPPGIPAVLFASDYALGLCIGGGLVVADASSGTQLGYRPFLPCRPEPGSLLVLNSTRAPGNVTMVLAAPGGSWTVASAPCGANGTMLPGLRAWSVLSSIAAPEPAGGPAALPSLVWPPNQILLGAAAYGSPYTPPPPDPISGQIIAGVSNFTFGLIIVVMALVVGTAIGLGVWYLRGNRFGKKTHPAVKEEAGEGGGASASEVPDGVPHAPRPAEGEDGIDARLAAALAAARVVTSLRFMGRRAGNTGERLVVVATGPAPPSQEPAGSAGDAASTYAWDPEGGVPLRTLDAPVGVAAPSGAVEDGLPPLARVDPRFSSARMAGMGHRRLLSDDLGSGTAVSSGSAAEEEFQLLEVPSSVDMRTAVDAGSEGASASALPG